MDELVTPDEFRAALGRFATGVTVIITFIVRALTPLSADQSYFVVILSTLLMHYYFDHLLFTKTEYVL